MFHKIKSVNALPDFCLSVQFAEGITKIYDVKQVFERWNKFRKFEESPEVFYDVQVDVGGYGVIWNDDIDLSCNELFENGKTVETPFDGLIAMSDATQLWGLNESTLRKAISYGKGGMQRQSQQVIWYNVQAMKMTDSKTDTRTGLPDAKATVRICEEFLARSMETNDLPGLAIGVSLGGEHWTGASGVRDVTTGDPLETGDVFHCGSLSKLFTSAAILKMIDSGVLRYEDRLMDVLPDVAFEDERAGEIRLWQMLSHTSGIGDVANFRWHEALAGERALADYVHSDEVCKSPLLWAPGGGRFRYSNIAYDILGHIVSRKSADYRMKIGEAEEMSYEDFVEKYLIEPAGMVSSSMKTFERVGVEADEECPLICEKIRERNAADGSFSGWTPMALPHEKNEKLDTVPVKYYPYTRAHVPCSALTSPLEDLLKWGDIHVAGFARTPEQHAEGGIISADAYTHIGYEYATVPKIGEKMGLGWFMREQNGHRLYGHEGGEAGFRASFWICPELGMTIAVLSNLSGAPAKKLNIMLFDKLVRG